MQERGLDSLYSLAEPQGGYFAARQAVTAGISRRLLSHYTTHEDIVRVAHGVYRLRRFPDHRFGDLIATVLWVGGDCAISHDSALSVYGLGAAMPSVIHVTVPRLFRGRRPGTIIHRAALATEEVVQRDDVPVTGVERTLCDVALAGDPSLAQQAAREAIERGLTTRARLATRIDNSPECDHLRQLFGLTKARRGVGSRDVSLRSAGVASPGA
jgi:predicted transcriptional regulator of viral defense system